MIIIIYSVCPIFTNPVDRLKTLSNGEAGKKLGGDKNEKGGNGFPHSLSLILINDNHHLCPIFTQTL